MSADNQMAAFGRAVMGKLVPYRTEANKPEPGIDCLTRLLAELERYRAAAQVESKRERDHQEQGQ